MNKVTGGQGQEACSHRREEGVDCRHAKGGHRAQEHLAHHKVADPAGSALSGLAWKEACTALCTLVSSLGVALPKLLAALHLFLVSGFWW